MTMTLQAHPRLYAGQEHIDRLRRMPRSALLKQTRQTLLATVDDYLPSPCFEWKLNTHNAHLLRARRMQTRVLSLLVAWRMTAEERYRQAAVDHVLEMGTWQYWSWITWRQDNADPLAIFDLSYGENSATLAIAWDWLIDNLNTPR